MSADEYAPPQVEDTRKPTGDSTRPALASRWQRLAAAVIDGLGCGIPGVILGGIAVALFQNIPFSGILARSPALQIFIQTCLLVISLFLTFLVLNWPLLRHRGQTIGKALVGIQVVDMTYFRPISAGRYLFQRVWPILLAGMIPWMMFGPLVILANAALIFRPQRNCLHDDIAGTRVIHAERLTP